MRAAVQPRTLLLALAVLAGLTMLFALAGAQEPPDLLQGPANRETGTIPDVDSIPVADNKPVPSNALPVTGGPVQPVEYSPVPGERAPGAPQARYTFHTPFEYYLTLLCVGILGVALAALTIMGWRSGLTPDFTRTFIIVVIVFASLFLITAGYSDQQAAPVYGLLGTIAGYIFGRSSPVEGTKVVAVDEKAADELDEGVVLSADSAHPAGRTT